MDGKHVLRADLRRAVLRPVFDQVHVSSGSVHLNGGKSEIRKAVCQDDILIKYPINTVINGIVHLASLA